MSRKRLTIGLPLDLILDVEISSNAKIVYAVLKSFLIGKLKPGQKPFVVVARREIMDKSGLSLHTVTKSIAALTRAGWIRPEKIWGSANRYFFTSPD